MGDRFTTTYVYLYFNFGAHYLLFLSHVLGCEKLISLGENPVKMHEEIELASDGVNRTLPLLDCRTRLQSMR